MYFMIKIVIVILVVAIIIRWMMYLRDQSKRDWKIIEDYEEKVYHNVWTKEQLLSLRNEISETTRAIGYRNELCRPHINRMIGYLEGAYKNTKE